MKINFVIKAILILSIIVFLHLAADTSDAYFPPTATSLLRKENDRKDELLRSDVEKLVDLAFKKHVGEKKETKKAVEAKSSKSNATHPDKKKEAISRELRMLLEQQYQDPALAKKISISFQDTDIVQAICLISKMVDIDIAIDSDVAGTIKHFNFKDVSIGCAFNIILGNNLPRLALINHLGVWRVVRLPLALEMLSLQEETMIEHDVDTKSRVVSYANWDNSLKDRIINLWKCIVGPRNIEKCYIVFDDLSKNIFFKGKPTHTAELCKYLDEIDIAIPQVRIEARVILADKDFEEAFGVQWSGFFNRANNITSSGYGYAGLGIGQGNANANVEPDDYKNLLGWALNFIPAVSSRGMNVKLPFVFGNKGFTSRRLNLLLNLAENKNEIKTVMKPTLLVNSGETAEILVGQELPQEVRLQETVEGSPTNVTTIQYKDIGLKIKVLPQIKANNQEIFLDVFVESSSIRKSPLLELPKVTGSAPQGNFNYTIKTSRSKNRVLLKSGQTTLISGLLVDESGKNESGIPYLSKIPVLGWFFKGSHTTIKDEQLLIFITPTLV